MAIRLTWMPEFLQPLSQSASNIFSSFQAPGSIQTVMWGSSIFNVYCLKTLVGMKMAFNIIHLAWVPIRHTVEISIASFPEPQSTHHWACIFPRALGGEQPLHTTYAASLSYQPEQPGPTQPRRKGQQKHSLERTVKKPSFYLEISFWR